jgi:hypothetical protein
MAIHRGQFILLTMNVNPLSARWIGLYPMELLVVMVFVATQGSSLGLAFSSPDSQALLILALSHASLSNLHQTTCHDCKSPEPLT